MSQIEYRTTAEVLKDFRVNLKPLIIKIIDGIFDTKEEKDELLISELEELIQKSFKYRSDFYELLVWLDLDEELNLMSGEWKHVWPDFLQQNGVGNIYYHLLDKITNLQLKYEIGE